MPAKRTRTSGWDGIDELARAVRGSEAIVIGAGAGLSTSAGYAYTGERLHRYFRDFEARYDCHDMYSLGLCPFLSREEFWGFWCRHIWLNRYAPIPSGVYQDLLGLVEGKEYFVLTTNVDHCFQRSGFDKRRLFYMQRDMGLFQSSSPRGAARHRTYDNYESVREMVLSEGFAIGDDGELLVPDGADIRMTVPPTSCRYARTTETR